MPVNEIQSPAYLLIRYQTRNAVHQARYYFQTGANFTPPTLENNFEGTLLFPPTDTIVNVSTIVTELFTRAAPSLPPNTTISQIVLMRGVPGANQFVGFNVLPTSNSFGSNANGVAASHTILIFGSATRQKFRATFFDGSDARPQVSGAGLPPVVDNGSFNWYVLRSPVPFATQDGNKLISVFSFNIGYNRRLARAYGRVQTP